MKHLINRNFIKCFGSCQGVVVGEQSLINTSFLQLTFFGRSFLTILSLYLLTFGFLFLPLIWCLFPYVSPFSLCLLDAPFSFCKFNTLTKCQVEGRGHPAVNCPAGSGWRNAQSNFHTISQLGSSLLLPRDLKRKEKPPLNQQPDSLEEIRRKANSERQGKRETLSRLTLD